MASGSMAWYGPSKFQPNVNQFKYHLERFLTNIHPAYASTVFHHKSSLFRLAQCCFCSVSFEKKISNRFRYAFSYLAIYPKPWSILKTQPLWWRQQHGYLIIFLEANTECGWKSDYYRKEKCILLGYCSGHRIPRIGFVPLDDERILFHFEAIGQCFLMLQGKHRLFKQILWMKDCVKHLIGQQLRNIPFQTNFELATFSHLLCYIFT